MSSDVTRHYEIGYKKPPIATRFKKGNTANPRGRTRGSKSLATLLDRALDMPVVVVENGARRKLTKREIVIARLVDRCARDDLRATKILLDMLHKLEARTALAEVETAAEDARELLRAKLDRLAEAQAADLAHTSPPQIEGT